MKTLRFELLWNHLEINNSSFMTWKEKKEHHYHGNLYYKQDLNIYYPFTWFVFVSKHNVFVNLKKIFNLGREVIFYNYKKKFLPTVSLFDQC